MSIHLPFDAEANQADPSMTQISTLTLMALFAFLVDSAGLLSIIG
jgi:hypothetical protein